MLPTVKCQQQKKFVTKTEMSPKLKWLSCHQNWNVQKKWNVNKTEMSQQLFCLQSLPKLICHKNWNVIKNEMSPKLKCHQNWNVIKKWSVTKFEMSSKLKCHQNWNVTNGQFLITTNFSQMLISAERQLLQMFTKRNFDQTPILVKRQFWLNANFGTTHILTKH